MSSALSISPDVTPFSFQFQNLAIAPADIFSILGYAPEEAPEHVRDVLDDVLGAAAGYCDICGGVRIIDDMHLAKDKQHLILQGVNFAVGKIIGGQFRGAEATALFACTIGPGLETWSRELMAKNDFLKGYIVDAVASVAVEAATDILHDRLQESAPDKKTSSRTSPGYCGWDVAEQQKLFSLLPPDFCGISLSPSSLMRPIKSVSGLIGLGRDMKKADYTCRFCDMQDCVYRRRREESLQD